MSETTRKRRFHFKDICPKDPAIRRFSEWPHANRGFFASFRRWLKESGYSESALHIYSVAARQAIGYLDKPYWKIDPDVDLPLARDYLCQRELAPGSRAGYHKGLAKLEAYIRQICHRPQKPRDIHWEYFTGSFPIPLQQDIRSFVQHLKRNWKYEKHHKSIKDTMSPLTLALRWIAERYPLNDMTDLTPERWFAYMDVRLAAGISSVTLNRELSLLRSFLRFLQAQGQEVCERFLLLGRLKRNDPLPRDVPAGQLRQLLSLIQSEAVSSHAGRSRSGRMDLAWFLLMLHSGLRTGEVRFLRFEHIDWENRRLRIEGSKGLKDRFVYLSQATIEALQAYLEVRGPADALPEQVFIHRHRAFSDTYCFQRLRTLGRRCNVHISPHQLRHSCATLLLNAGAPVLTVQAILGHKYIDTTLGYARLYDGTIAADYYRAMPIVERHLSLPEDRLAQPPSIGQLIALVDSLHEGTLNQMQNETVRQLRAGLVAFSETEIAKISY